MIHELLGQLDIALGPSLEMIEEIQRTGDIFFPLGWLNATLDGHNTSSAAMIVREFLDARSDLPPRLRGKLLQGGGWVVQECRDRLRHGMTG